MKFLKAGLVALQDAWAPLEDNRDMLRPVTRLAETGQTGTGQTGLTRLAELIRLINQCIVPDKAGACHAPNFYCPLRKPDFYRRRGPRWATTATCSGPSPAWPTRLVKPRLVKSI